MFILASFYFSSEKKIATENSLLLYSQYMRNLHYFLTFFLTLKHFMSLYLFWLLLLFFFREENCNPKFIVTVWTTLRLTHNAYVVLYHNAYVVYIYIYIYIYMMSFVAKQNQCLQVGYHLHIGQPKSIYSNWPYGI